MSQQANSLELNPKSWRHLSVDASSMIPLAGQIAQQLRWLIVSGNLRPDTQLPALRTLGDQLGVSFHTIRAAFRQLEVEGLVTTRQGRGTRTLAPEIGRLARSGVPATSFAIGVILPAFTGFYAPFLRGLQELSDSDPFLYFICDSRESRSLAQSHFEHLIARGVDGIVLVSIPLQDRGVAEQVVGNPTSFPAVIFADLPRYPQPRVLLDLRKAGYVSVHHLAEHGHDRIGLVTPPLHWTNVAEIHLGYRQGIEHSSLAYSQDLVEVVPDFGRKSGLVGTAALLDAEDPPSALFLPNDELLAGAMTAINDRGIKVPEDVAVICLTDNMFLNLIDPPITTVSLPSTQLGRHAYRLLRRALDGEDITGQEVMLEGELIIRQSCGCFPQSGVSLDSGV